MGRTAPSTAASAVPHEPDHTAERLDHKTPHYGNRCTLKIFVAIDGLGARPTPVAGTAAVAGDPGQGRSTTQRRGRTSKVWEPAWRAQVGVEAKTGRFGW
jgi:hypothetical protein